MEAGARGTRPAVALAAAALCLALVGAACGGPQEPGGEGAECYRDADCQLGLACVPAGEDARVCSRDVSGIVSMVEGPPPPPPPDAGDPDGG